jgi:hypothetical protein
MPSRRNEKCQCQCQCQRVQACVRRDALYLKRWGAIYCFSPAATATGTDTFPARANNSDLEAIRRLARLAV